MTTLTANLLVLLLEAERRGIIRDLFRPIGRWFVETVNTPKQIATDFSSLTRTAIWCLVIATTAYVLGNAFRASKG